MATYTENYNLEMPDQNDFYNIDVQNQNMQKIDTALAAAGNNPELEGNVAGLVEKVGTTTDVGGSDTTGSVMGKLNNIITSSGGISETLKNGVNILQRMAVFTSNGTFTVPEGVSCIKVTAIAAGGKGASGSTGSGKYNSSGSATYERGGGGGGSGECCIDYPVKVTPLEVLKITVGTGNSTVGNKLILSAGGSASLAYGGDGSAGGGCGTGGNSTRYGKTRGIFTGGFGAGSEGSTNATPGGGGGAFSSANSVVGGAGGGGHAGAISSSGYGSSGVYCGAGGGGGGIAFFGTGGSGGHGAASSSDTVGGTGGNGTGFGSGGGGGGANHTKGGTGGTGAPGIVLIEW